MADTKISALSAGTALAGTEEMPGVQSAATVKFTAAQIKTYTSKSPVTIPGGTLTADENALTITQTWNNGAVEFQGALKVNVTNTASANLSKIVDFQVDGASAFAVHRNSLSDWDYSKAGSGIGTAGVLITPAAALWGTGGAPGLRLGSTTTIQFGTSSPAPWHAFEMDVAIRRNAAGVLEINDGNAGTYRDLRVRSVRMDGTVVGSLVAAATAGAGALAYVTDASATTRLSTVAGGGANKVMVFSDGTNWLIL